ncbi:MAG: hypothetical protein IT365_04865 [Candidatus Hydrogenedentes bacterium]|nr:hypothetical protein [Candidatus Hydrogenedentota bacterium]
MDSGNERLFLLCAGLLFTFLGGLKLYGIYKGYEGGPHKRFWERLRAGSCAEGHCRLPAQWRIPFYLLLDLLFLGFGLYLLWGAFTMAFS